MKNKKKIIIYTVNTNNYDDFKLKKSISKLFKYNHSFRYFLFTDQLLDLSKYKFIEQILIVKNKQKNTIFLNHLIKKPIPIPKGISIDRYIKLNPIIVLPDHDISIYHDARIILDSKIIKELTKFNANFDWISVKHRYRKTFKEELFTCFINKKINFRELKHIKSFAKKNSFNSISNKNINLSENGLLIRKSNHKVFQISYLWTQITVITIRDQLSLPLTFNILKNLKIKRKFFKEDFFNSKIAYLSKRKERKSIIDKIVFKLNLFIRYIFIKTFDKFI